MEYLKLYDEVKINVDNTLSLSKNRLTEAIAILGVVFFFQDQIKYFFMHYLPQTFFGKTITALSMPIKIVLLAVIFVVGVLYSKKIWMLFIKKINDFKRMFAR
jgi:hypothetical protein